VPGLLGQAGPRNVLRRRSFLLFEELCGKVALYPGDGQAIMRPCLHGVQPVSSGEIRFLSTRNTHVLTVRPKVAELTFQLYGRPLHPELFQIYQTRRIERGGYWARVEITSAGHVVTWHYQGFTLTEVAAAAHHPLPKRRRLLFHRVGEPRSEQIECRGGIVYHTSFQLEPADPAIFWMFQQHLASEGEQRGLLHTFGSSGRLGMGAISYVNIETRNRSVLIQAFHTFPDDLAIVKSQSLFRLPESSGRAAHCYPS
jgi:hypothetical protein